MSVQSVHRALEILALFSPARPRLGITEISQLMGLPKATIHGLVRTLADFGFLAQDPETRRYTLGLKIYELGTMLAGSLTINRIGAGPAQRLSRQAGLMTRLAIWDQNSVLVTLSIFSPSQEVAFHQLGPRVPAHCTAIGKAILAFLPPTEIEAHLAGLSYAPYTANTITTEKELLEDLEQIRLKGYAIDREEFIPGLVCIGAPVFDRSGRPTASISLSGKPSRLTGRGLSGLADDLVRTAMEISHQSGFLPELPAGRKTVMQQSGSGRAKAGD